MQNGGGRWFVGHAAGAGSTPPQVAFLKEAPVGGRRLSGATEFWCHSFLVPQISGALVQLELVRRGS